MDKICFKTMGGGGKKNMKARADAHFMALQQIVPGVARLMLFDFDDDSVAFHPKSNNAVLAEWKRKNIENSLLVPDVWRRAALQQLQLAADDLFAQTTLKIIDDFFIDQNLTLPPGRTWRLVSANIFSVVNGKNILFENPDSLFQQLRATEPAVKLIREAVALCMTAADIHDDVQAFRAKVGAMTGPDGVHQHDRSLP